MTSTPERASSSARTVLGTRTFQLLWASWSAALLGETLLAVTVMIVIYEQSGSALRTLGVVLAMRLPPVLLGPVAGRLVDRLPRRALLIGAEALRAVVVLSLWLLLPALGTYTWPIDATVAVMAAVGAVAKPARLATIPRLVPRSGLVAANALVATSTQASGALGFVLGGVLVAGVGLRASLTMTATAFAIAALLALPLHVSAPQPRDPAEPPAAPAPRRSLASRLAAGWRAARTRPIVRDLLIMEIAEWFPHAMWTAALMLAFTERALGGPSLWWTWQNASFYVGTIVGALLATVLATQLGRHAGPMIVGNALLFALLTLCYAWSPNLAVALTITGLFGPTATLRDVAQDALLQAKVGADRLGRVLALRAAGTNLAFLLAAPAFAWAADALPVRPTYTVGALMYLATALFAALSPSIRSARVDADDA